MKPDKIFGQHSSMLIALALCFGILSATSQVKQPARAGLGTIMGTVVDNETKDELPGCNVEIRDTPLGASADMKGFYMIRDVPPGMYTLRISYVGYARGEVDSVVVQASDTVRVDYRMMDIFSSYADSARNDIAAGRARILVVGLIVTTGGMSAEEEKRITRRYGFEYDYVGCTFMAAEHYNKVVEEYLAKRNGPNWEKRMAADIERLKKSHPRSWKLGR